jgi:hypothetical protein
MTLPHRSYLDDSRITDPWNGAQTRLKKDLGPEGKVYNLSLPTCEAQPLDNGMLSSALLVWLMYVEANELDSSCLDPHPPL